MDLLPSDVGLSAETAGWLAAPLPTQPHPGGPAGCPPPPLTCLLCPSCPCPPYTLHPTPYPLLPLQPYSPRMCPTYRARRPRSSAADGP
jgi:hypothetical protein